MAFCLVGTLLFSLIPNIGTGRDQDTADELANSRAIEVLRGHSDLFERDDAGRLYWVILNGNDVTTDVIRTISRCRTITAFDAWESNEKQRGLKHVISFDASAVVEHKRPINPRR